MTKKRKQYHEKRHHESLKKKSVDVLDRPDQNIGWMTRREWMSERREGRDYVVCQICGFPARTLSTHVSRVHGLNRQTYFGPMQCEELNEFASEKLKGDKNPWANHGGKFSPWSKKFIVEDHDRFESIQKARENRVPNCSLEYFLNRTDGNEEEARELQTERQRTFTLEKCIEKYGEEEGRRRWQKRQDKWQETLNSKTDEEIAEINRKKHYRGGMTSKIEQEIMEKIRVQVPDLNHQFRLKNGTRNWYLYDFALGNRIIEFNGDFWHAHPKKFGPDDIIPNSSKMSAREIWERDGKKLKAARDQGYEVMVVWESDFKREPVRVVAECVDFLTGSSESSSTLESFMN